MKLTVKLIAVVLSALLALSLCACEPASEPVDPDITDKNEDTSDPADAYTTEEETEPETDPAVTEPEETAAESSIDDGNDVLGTTEGSRYENARIGLGCILPEGWNYSSEEDIRLMNNATAELAGDTYLELIENATVFYDMLAMDADELNNINVNLEKLNALQLTLLDVAENYKAAVPYMREMFENMGYTDFSSEIVDVILDGETVPAMRTTAQISGIRVYQLMLSVKCDGYLANIAVTTYIEDTTADILSNFYRIG